MLKLINVVKTYHSKSGDSCTALNKVNITFAEKGVTFILGKSGSGKSTLLNVVGGIDTIDSGDILIKNKSSKDFTPSEYDSYRNTYLGFIFQDFNILEKLTVEENISLALKLQGCVKEEIASKTQEIIDKVELTGYEKRGSNELSGGQIQRVAIARALIKDPEVIMADEPTGNLDSNTGKQIMGLLQELAKDKLVVIVSHDRDFANKYADRIIELKDGQVLKDYEVSRNRRVEKQKRIRFKQQETNIMKEDNDFKLKKSNIPFKYVWRTALNSLSSKSIRLIITLFLFISAITVFSASTLVSDYDISRSLVMSMEENEIDDILIRKCYDTSVDYSVLYDIGECDFNGFSAENSLEIQELAESLGLKTFNLLNETMIFDNIYNKTTSSSDLFAAERIYGFLEMREDMSPVLVDGRMPVEMDEVLATEYLLEYLLFEYDITSTSELYEKDIYIGTRIVNITGIIDTDHEKYEYLRDVEGANLTEEELELIPSQYEEFELNVRRYYSRLLTLPGFQEATHMENLNVNLRDMEGFYYGNIDLYVDLDGETNFSYPQEEVGELVSNEVYLSLDMFLSRVALFDSEVTITQSKEEIKASPGVLDQFIGQTYSVKFEQDNILYEKEIYIKGFYDVTCEDDEKYTSLISTTMLNDLQRARYDGLYVEISEDVQNNVEFIKTINEDGFVQLSSFSSDLYLVKEITDDTHTVLTFATIALAVFAGVIIYVFISNSIQRKQKDIGILRSIGASSFDVSSIFLLESSIIGAISIVISTTLVYLLIVIVNDQAVTMYKNNLVVFAMSTKLFLKLGLFALGMTVLSTIVPIARLLIMKPIDVVRKR